MRFEHIEVKKHRNYVIPFRKDSFIVSFGSDQDFGDEEDYLDWLNEKASQFPEGFVVVTEDEIPIGQLELTIVEYEGRSIGYVNLYYLIPEKRGIGLGKKLHEYAVGFFRKQAVSEFHLRVSPNNDSAISFYRKNGLKELGSEVDGKVIRMKGIV